MVKKFLKDKVAIMCVLIITFIIILGIFAKQIAPNDPYIQNIAHRYAGSSIQYPLGTDALGRCILSRLIYGIRTTLFIAFLTMIGTIFVGSLVGIISGFFGGIIDEILMRFCDIMMSFPSQVMILAIVGILGVGINNVVFAYIIVKWTWYARMIRGFVLEHRHKNYMYYSQVIKSKRSYIIFKHIIPNILSEIALLATLDMGWVILNISTLSFLGLGVQAPTPEWGLMLSDAKNVISTRPEQMIAPAVLIFVVVATFNLLGDCFRDLLDIKGESLDVKS